MKITTEKTIQIKSDENSAIVRANVKILEDGSGIEINIISNSITEQPIDENYLNEHFPIVEVSKLSLDDKFLQGYKARDKKTVYLKSEIEEIIKTGIPDFRCPTMDPSIGKDGNIYFAKGQKFAGNETPLKWEEKAKAFMPEKNSRIGTYQQYIAFLAVLIKYLVEEENYNPVIAWNAVCNNSHFFWEKGKASTRVTGNCKVGKWYDLLNSCKIIRKEEKDTFWNNCRIIGDYYLKEDEKTSLLRIIYTTNTAPIEIFDFAAAWLVMDV